MSRGPSTLLALLVAIACAMPASGCLPWPKQDATPAEIEAPSAPSELAGAAVNQTQIDVSWVDESDNEEGFRILRDGVSLVEVDVNVTLYRDTALEANRTYQYAIEAFNEGGTSEQISCNVSTLPLAPTAPEGLSGNATARRHIQLSWTNTAQDAEGLRVYRDGVVIAEIFTAVGSFSDSSVRAGTTYQYAVEAFNSGGPSPQALCSVTTPPNPPLSVTLDRVGVAFDHDPNLLILKEDRGEIYLHVVVTDGKTTSITRWPDPDVQPHYSLGTNDHTAVNETCFSTEAVGDYLQITVLGCEDDDGMFEGPVWETLNEVGAAASGGILPLLNTTLQDVLKKIFGADDSVGSYEVRWNDGASWGVGTYEDITAGDLRLWFTVSSPGL